MALGFLGIGFRAEGFFGLGRWGSCLKFCLLRSLGFLGLEFRANGSGVLEFKD